MLDHLQLGATSLLRIGLGTNRLRNTPDAHHFLRAATEAGIQFIDTANIYQDGDSELSIAAALSPYEKSLCITTKGGYTKYGPGDYRPECHPDTLKQKVDESLLHLRLDQIDLYQLHRIDPNVPLEDSLGALKDLQIAGKIRHLGLSEVTVPQIQQAQNLIQVVTVQNRYNLFEREHDEVVDYCEQQNIIFIPFFPLGSSRQLFPQGLMQKLETIAKHYHCSAQQIALAWLLHRAPNILPIPGTLSLNHLQENIAALSIKLTPRDYQQLS